MKSYTVTVNGVTYDVTIEENTTGAVSAPVVQRAPVMPEAPKAKSNSQAKGDKVVSAGAAGKILKVDVKVGEHVNVGQQVAVLEVMKMETPIVSSDEGVVATVDIKEGDNVEAGAALVTLN